MKRFVTAPLILAVALAASPASAQERRHGNHDRGAMKQRIAEKIGLTDVQRTQLEQLRAADSEGIKAARQAVKEKRQALEDAMMADPPNQGAVDARRADLSQAHNEMVRQMTNSRMKALQILTPQQREQLRQMRLEMRNRRGEKRGKFGERSGAPDATN